MNINTLSHGVAGSFSTKIRCLGIVLVGFTIENDANFDGILNSARFIAR
jgi:hypothetical protein